MECIHFYFIVFMYVLWLCCFSCIGFEEILWCHLPEPLRDIENDITQYQLRSVRHLHSLLQLVQTCLFSSFKNCVCAPLMQNNLVYRPAKVFCKWTCGFAESSTRVKTNARWKRRGHSRKRWPGNVVSIFVYLFTRACMLLTHALARTMHGSGILIRIYSSVHWFML